MFEGVNVRGKCPGECLDPTEPNTIRASVLRENGERCGELVAQELQKVKGKDGHNNNKNNNNNIQDNVYGAVIMAEPLREFTRFI